METLVFYFHLMVKANTKKKIQPIKECSKKSHQQPICFTKFTHTHRRLRNLTVCQPVCVNTARNNKKNQSIHNQGFGGETYRKETTWKTQA